MPCRYSQLPSRQLPIWAFLLAGLVSAPTPANAGPVIIRTYDVSGLSEGDRSAGFATATAILQEAGLEISRLACDRAETTRHDGPCRLPLQAHELSVRLVRLPEPDRSARQVTLGYSLVETSARLGSLATVYVDRVSNLAATSHIDLPTLVGRAIAHEIGHLLLGTSAHADAGVMRATWSPDTIRHSTARDWRFTAGEAEMLRAAARRRHQEHGTRHKAQITQVERGRL
jgi:hypothetical protein